MDLLTHCLVLRPGTAVLSTIVQHHANMLPSAAPARVELLDAPKSPPSSCFPMRAARWRIATVPIGIVAITGASNVTGEIFPIAEIGRLRARTWSACSPSTPPSWRRIGPSTSSPSALTSRASPATRYTCHSRRRADRTVSGSADAEPMLAGGGAVTYVTTTMCNQRHCRTGATRQPER